MVETCLRKRLLHDNNILFSDRKRNLVKHSPRIFWKSCTMTTIPISDCHRCYGGNRPSIFQAKDPEDIKTHYDQILASYRGKLSAEIYLEIMKTLNGKIQEDQLNDDITIPEYCRNTKVPTIRPTIDIEVSREVSKSDHAPIERSYKKIFKNARETENQKRKSASKSETEQESNLQSVNAVDLTPAHGTCSDKVSQFTTSEVVVGAVSRRKCELVGFGVNNYLAELREKRSRTLESIDKISHSMSLPDKQPSTDSHEGELRGDVGLFAYKKVDELLQNNSNDQAEKVKTIIGEPSERLSIPNDRQSLFDVLKNNAFRMKKEDVYGFEEKLPKWRRKFVVDKIEQSVGLDTVDESDIGTGETSFHSDNNPPDDEEKLRKIVSKPSRIPYIEEVRDLNRQLFDKIALKWDKIAARCVNHEDFSLTPNWSRLVGDINLRSVDPFMGRILKTMKRDSKLRKAFVPNKYQAHAWQRLLLRKEEKDEEERKLRTTINNLALTSNPVPKVKRNILECCKNQWLDKDGRGLLNDLVEETDRKAKAGYFSWEKDEIAEHYLKLCAIIKTKKRPAGHE